MTATTMKCVTCGHTQDYGPGETYCSNCGQKQPTGRFSIRHIFKDAFTVFLNLERGLIPSTKYLFVNPGKLVRGYWRGQTRSYTNPLRFLFVAVTLSTLTTIGTGVYDKQMEQMKEMNAGMFSPQVREGMTEEEIAQQAEIQEATQRYIRKYLNLFSLIMTPFAAAALWILLKDTEVYYGEHIISACYYIGLTSALGIPLTFLSLADVLGPYENTAISLGLSTVYGMYMLKSIYKIPWWRAIITTPVLMILTAILMTVVLIVFGFLIALIF
ncbi:DUF3667 domain-containing protein [Phaeocystidibacter luteus]|uniref:DUF3667 domain-containing protein n=1 Tax=Phaeocystidibacter luteus TaxID=911197 RepID=A0A6N6RM22_9FLAO|nr:DUF3667 domain-containing protein [Phaeocystidibacter luteus]KAB2814619.1 DUF3667 domain-containing protein [Phaeocystidibacter luteus]